MKEKKLYRIEEISRITGMTKRTLRYYEDLKLIKPVRTDSSYRLYSDEDIERVNRIREIKESLGFSLGEVKDLLELYKNVENIIKEKKHNPVLIENSMKEIEKQISLVENKETKLKKVKAKLKYFLVEMEKLSSVTLNAVV